VEEIDIKDGLMGKEITRNEKGQFEPGCSGNPEGRTPEAKYSEEVQQIVYRKLMESNGKGTTRLEGILEILLTQAEKGKPWAQDQTRKWVEVFTKSKNINIGISSITAINVNMKDGDAYV
jgi:hypothetical protein